MYYSQVFLVTVSTENNAVLDPGLVEQLLTVAGDHTDSSLQ